MSAGKDATRSNGATMTNAWLGPDLPDSIADELPDDCARNRVRRYVMEMVAAERERWKEALERRGRIHGESSRIYARLASAVRAGADDVVLGQLLRAEVRNRA